MSAQKLKPSGVLGGLAGLIGFSAIAGVLVTAMVTPTLAVTSMTAKSSISIFDDLPTYITIGEQSQQNQIFANRGGQPVQIATIYKQNRKEVAWGDVSQFLKDAAVDGEDRRFFDHGGVDLPSVIRAAIKNTTESEAGSSGSSTLDMQLVKNILVQQALEITDPAKQKQAYNDAIAGSLDRKLKEMKLAISLDKKYTKKQILLAYLNIVGMGGTTYGVEAGAERYFTSNAKDLTLAQAASLVAIVQQPTLQSLADPKYYPANKIRRDEILKAMLTAKDITQKQYDEAVATKIEDEMKVNTAGSGCRAALDAPTACDYVSKIITSNLDPATTPNAAPVVSALGSTPAERTANWEKGGYQIYTSINLDLQDVAQEQLNRNAPPTENRLDLGAAADTVEGGTGRVLVMAQNKIFDDAGIAEGTAPDASKTALNLSTDHPYGNSNGFSTGSTFKVFDLANWLQNGHGLGDVVDGSGPQTYQFQDFQTSCLPGSTGNGPFKVNNDTNGGRGIMTVKQGLIGSVNNAFMQMAKQQDLCSIRDTANSMGAHLASFKEINGGTLEIDNPTMVLGTNEQAPLTMAAAAATVGANGLHCTPIIIDSVVDPAGKKLPGQTPICNQALTAEVANGVADAMVGSMTSGTSGPGNPHDHVAIGGKTGTSPNTDQDWIMGTTTKLATAVWTGNVDGALTPLRKFNNPITGQQYYAYARFNILKAIMAKANTDPALRGAASFPPATAAMLSGHPATVPDVTGQTPEQAKSLLEGLKFQYTDGGPEPSSLPVGTVTRSDPPAGSNVPQGQNITVFTSDGTQAITMPNVINDLKPDAVQKIQNAGFDSNNIDVKWVPGTPAGPGSNVCKVQSSNPTAGTTSPTNAAVTIKVFGKPDGTDPGTCT